MRLQRFLARAGVASRRGSEDLITAGRVAVNGITVTELGTKIEPSRDRVTVDGIEVSLAGAPVYIALNKPPGVVTTMRDPHGRPSVASLVPTERYPGLFPVGRLDQDTTGLLLFTTDGELAHRLLHPRWKVPKTYRAQVEGVPREEALSRLRDGVLLEDGPTAPAEVRVLAAGPVGARVEITVREGRKRQVRRMFSAVGHPVIALERVRFGPVVLEGLDPGRWRLLTDDEVKALKQSVGMEE